MAERLAIDWEPHRLCGVLADVSPGGVKVQKTLSIAADDATMSNPEEIGRWLADELRANRISAKQVSVTLPREDVVVRHLELPPVSDEELPELVKFQAAAKSTIPIGQLLLDFVPLPEKGTGRDVLVATVGQERINDLRKVAATAGLDLASVGVSSIAAAELITLAEQQIGHATGDVCVIVAQHGDRVEITLWDGAVYFTHSTLSSQSTAVLAEISRAVIALQKQIHGAKIARAWMIGDESDVGELGQAIKDRFTCDLSYFDPFNSSNVQLNCEHPGGSSAAFAGPIGQLIGQSGGRASGVVDFLSPRKAAKKTDFTQIKRIGIAAAVVMLIAAVFVYRSMEVTRLEEETAALNSNIAEVNGQLEQLKPRVEETAKVEAWASRSMNWLDETKWLTETMNGTDNYYLTRLRFANGTRDVKGNVNAKGHAKQRVMVDALKADLMSRDNLELQAKATPETGRDSDFPYEFELDFNLKSAERSAKK